MRTLSRSPLFSAAVTSRRRVFGDSGVHITSNLGFRFAFRDACFLSSAVENPTTDAVEEILTQRRGRIDKLMKMERRKADDNSDSKSGRWFPYLDVFRFGSASVGSREVLEAFDPFITEARKERMKRAVGNRSYSVCLVVDGLTDFGNVSATFRSADALGIQSVHVISNNPKKRYRDNRSVSMSAEKWLDIEQWGSPLECFTALKMRGYRIVTAHLGRNSVSIYEVDWTRATAIVVGNEHMGISDESLLLSDVHCNIPVRGMVDSFNVSVAAGILMHHAVSERVSRLGYHGDLSPEERQILLAEFFLRHKANTISYVEEYAKKMESSQ